MLLARGLQAGAAPEAWTLERPRDVTAVHRAYVEAGAEGVQTNTFGGHPARLDHFGLGERCEEIMHAAVEAARASGAAFVIGDVGPTGEYLVPVGQGDPGRWHEGFLRQAQALAEAGVDGFHIETMTDLREARIALEAIRSRAPEAPVAVSLTFERRKRGFFTMMGNPLVASLRELLDAGATAVGANCSITSADMVDLGSEARNAGLGPLVLQPNAGQPEMVAGSPRYAQDPEDFAADLAPLAERGAVALGGCCGTDPRFIAALVRRLGRTP